MASNENAGFGSCPTVRKKDENAPGGFVEVNQEDFNEDVDELFIEGAVEDPEDPEDPEHIDYGSLTKDDLADLLNARDIEFSMSVKKDELITLLVDSDEAKKED